MHTRVALLCTVFASLWMLPPARAKLAQAAFAALHPNPRFSPTGTKATTAIPVRTFQAQFSHPVRLPLHNGIAQRSSARPFSMSGAAAENVVEDKIKVLYDGECPICLYEIQWLEKRAKNRGINDLEFIDVADKEYTPDKCAGITYEKGMEVMHVVGKDGTIHDSVSAFEILYGAVELTWLSNLLRNKRFQNVANPVYDFWAKLRLPLTGRPSLDVLLERRRAEEVGCRENVCVKK